MTDAGRAPGPDERAAAVNAPLARRTAFAAALLVLVHVLLIVLDARAMGLATDESSYFGCGRVILRHGWVHEATRFQGPLGLYANQLFLEPFGGEFPPGGLTGTGGEHEPILRGRLGTLPFALLSALLVFVWARRLFGDAGGLLALLLHTLHPVLLGYSSLMLVDAQHAATTLLALYVLWRWLETRSRRLLPWLGVALGLALAVKYLAVLLALVIGLSVAVAAAWQARGGEWRVRGGRALAGLLVVALCALATLHAAYLFRGGFAGRDPAGFASGVVRAVCAWPGLGHAAALLPAPFLQGVDYQLMQSEREWMPFLEGTFAPRQPAIYVLSLLYKTPEVALACLLLALGLRARRLCARTSEPGWHTTALALLPWALVYFTYLSLSRMQLGIRYALPLVPILCLGAGGLLWRAERRAPGARVFVLLALLALVHGRELARAWPDWIAYSNRFAGGQRLAFRHFRDTSNDFGQYRHDGLARLKERHPDLAAIDKRSGARFGRLAVDHDALMYDPGAPDGRPLTWLDWLEPLDHLGASWWVFEVTPEVFERELERRDDARLRSDLVLAYLGAGRRAEAERHLARLEPERAAPLTALLATEDAARARPERATLEALIEAWRAHARPDQAAAVAAEHAELLSDSDVAALARSEALEEGRDFLGAARVLERTWNDARIPARVLRVQLLRRAGAFDEAGALLDEIERGRGERGSSQAFQSLKAEVDLRREFLRLVR